MKWKHEQGRKAGSKTMRYARKSWETITTPPSNSLMARAKASMEPISKWLVGSSIRRASRQLLFADIIMPRTQEKDVWMFHSQLCEHDTGLIDQLQSSLSKVGVLTDSADRLTAV